MDIYGGAKRLRLKAWTEVKVPAFILFVAAYFVSVRLAEHLYGSFSVPSPFWFPDSVLLCALLLIPKEHWWLYLSASLPVHVVAGAPAGTPHWFLLISALNDLLKALFAAWLLQRVLRRPVRLRTLHEFMVFLGIAALAAPLVSALGGVVARHALGNPVWSVGYKWFLGNALGQVVITPTLLYLCTINYEKVNIRLKETIFLSVGLGAVLYFAFLIPHAGYSPLFLYAPLPFLIAAAVRLRPLGTASAVSLVALVSMLSAVEGKGLFSGNSPSENVLSMQLFLLLVSVPLLSLAILIEERRGVESDLRRVQMGLKEAQRLAGLGSWEWHPDTDTVVWSDELYRLAGWDRKVPLPPFAERPKLFTAESWERLRGATEESLQTGKPFELDVEMIRVDGTARWLIVRGEVQDENGRIVCLRGTCQDITERKHAEEELRESEDKLSLLLNSTAEAIYGIDFDGRCTFCNPACLRALGFARADALLGRNMHDLIHHTRADGTLFPAEESRIYRAFREGEGAHIDEIILWRADGTSFPAECWGYPQRKGHVIVGAVVAFVDITERKVAEQALARMNQRLLEAQEQERARIARELHDDIGQRLALLTMELDNLHGNSSNLSTDVRSRIHELRSQSSQIAGDIQFLSHELHSSKLEYLGVAAAMKGFCREFGQQQRVEVDFNTHDLPSRVPPDISLCLFRVLQEALHNSAKHSGVRRFEVGLRRKRSDIELTVKDHGSGFDSQAAKMGPGLGLISMEERLKLLNGTFSIESDVGHGTTVHASVPLHSGRESLNQPGDGHRIAG